MEDPSRNNPPAKVPVKEVSPTQAEVGFENFECPITQLWFYDPVVASDGQTYEREAIENTTLSPLFANPIDKKLFPNCLIKSIIHQMLSKNPLLWDQVYRSPALRQQIRESIANKDAKKFLELIEKDPRLLTEKISDGKTILEYVCTKEYEEFLPKIIHKLLPKDNKAVIAFFNPLSAQLFGLLLQTKNIVCIQLVAQHLGWLPEFYYQQAKAALDENNTDKLNICLKLGICSTEAFEGQLQVLQVAAVRKSSLDMIQTLLDKNKSNQNSYKAHLNHLLSIAIASNRDDSVLKYLLDAGADPFVAANGDAAVFGRLAKLKGWDATHYQQFAWEAIAKKDLAPLKLCCELGIDINKKSISKRCTLLHAAIEAKFEAGANLLLGMKARTNILDQQHNTALHLALMFDASDALVTRIIDNNKNEAAEVTMAANKANKTPLQLALEKKRSTIAEKLNVRPNYNALNRLHLHSQPAAIPRDNELHLGDGRIIICGEPLQILDKSRQLIKSFSQMEKLVPAYFNTIDDLTNYVKRAGNRPHFSDITILLCQLITDPKEKCLALLSFFSTLERCRMQITAARTISSEPYKRILLDILLDEKNVQQPWYNPELFRHIFGHINMADDVTIERLKNEAINLRRSEATRIAIIKTLFLMAPHDESLLAFFLKQINPENKQIYSVIIEQLKNRKTISAEATTTLINILANTKIPEASIYIIYASICESNVLDLEQVKLICLTSTPLIMDLIKRLLQMHISYKELYPDFFIQFVTMLDLNEAAYKLLMLNSDFLTPNRIPALETAARLKLQPEKIIEELMGYFSPDTDKSSHLRAASALKNLESFFSTKNEKDFRQISAALMEAVKIQMGIFSRQENFKASNTHILLFTIDIIKNFKANAPDISDYLIQLTSSDIFKVRLKTLETLESLGIQTLELCNILKTMASKDIMPEIRSCALRMLQQYEDFRISTYLYQLTTQLRSLDSADNPASLLKIIQLILESTPELREDAKRALFETLLSVIEQQKDINSIYINALSSLVCLACRHMRDLLPKTVEALCKYLSKVAHASEKPLKQDSLEVHWSALSSLFERLLAEVFELQQEVGSANFDKIRQKFSRQSQGELPEQGRKQNNS